MEKSLTKKFPKEIAIALIVVSVVVSLLPVFASSNNALFAVSINIGVIFIVMPLVFVAVGLIQKIRDRSFNLWNMYYLGMLVAIVFNLRKLMS